MSVFLGYPENQKAWHLWSLHKKKIIISTDIIFLENAIHYFDTPDELSINELDEYYTPLDDIPLYKPVVITDIQVEKLIKVSSVNLEEVQKPAEEVYQ